MTPADAGRLMQAAVSAHRRGDLPRAEETYRALTVRYPNFPDAWHYYGLLLYQRGDTEKGLECLRRAQALRPDDPVFLVNLGRVLYEQGDFLHAVVCLEQAQKTQPGDPNGFLLLAQALVAVERGGEVVAELERFGALERGADWQLKMLVGECRDQAGDRPGAMAAYDEAVRMTRPPETAPLLRKADAAMKAGEAETAATAFEAALARDTRCAGAWLGLATLATEAGEFDRADTLARQALEHDPRCYQAWGLLAARPNAAASDEFVEKLEHMAHETSQDPESWPLQFAHGRVLESLRDYDAAFAAYRQGNRMQSQRHPYSEKRQETYTRSLIGGMDRTFVNRHALIGVDDPGVIFICGMPRSGTTLVESILAAHPSVMAGGEMRWVHDRLRTSIGMTGMIDTGQWLREASDDALRGLAQDWAETIKEAACGKPRVTDKMPGNYHLAGLLHVCFPKSPIVYVERDARDNGLSCFTTAFHEGHGFSHALETVGHYYSLHRQLMAHWQRVLGNDRIIRVEYEALVNAPEAETRRLLEALNLPWDPACLQFHHNRRRVGTASVYQVRQPLYRSSVGRWRAFERHLQPLLVALASTPPV